MIYCTQYLLFTVYVITKNKSTQFNNIGESIFETEEDTETKSQYSDHYSSCKKSDMNFYDQTVVTAWRKKKSNMKRIVKLSLCSVHH